MAEGPRADLGRGELTTYWCVSPDLFRGSVCLFSAAFADWIPARGRSDNRALYNDPCSSSSGVTSFACMRPQPYSVDRPNRPEMFARCRDARGRTFSAVGTVNETEIEECFFRDGKIAQGEKYALSSRSTGTGTWKKSICRLTPFEIALAVDTQSRDLPVPSSVCCPSSRSTGDS